MAVKEGWSFMMDSLHGNLKGLHKVVLKEGWSFMMDSFHGNMKDSQK